jgi:hypothetical protein
MLLSLKHTHMSMRMIGGLPVGLAPVFGNQEVLRLTFFHNIAYVVMLGVHWLFTASLFHITFPYTQAIPNG